MIQYSDISVVIQGPFSNTTDKLIKSIIEGMPGIEIVLSTWDNTVSSLSLDSLPKIKLILSEDPGSTKDALNEEKSNNMNRQIISTYRGIKATTRKYVLKIRTDAEFKHDGFIKPLEFYGDSYLVIPSSVSSNLEFYEYPFLLSDISVFGRRDLVETLWNIDISDPSNARLSSMSSTVDELKIDAEYKLSLPYYGSEQYLWINYWNKQQYKFNSIRQFYKLHKKFIAEKIIILDNDIYGIGNYKYPEWFNNIYKGEYNYKIWRKYYTIFVNSKTKSFSRKKYKLYLDLYTIKTLKCIFGRTNIELIKRKIKRYMQ